MGNGKKTTSHPWWPVRLMRKFISWFISASPQAERSGLLHSLLSFLEQPLVTAPIGILGGLLGLMFPWMMYVCGISIILAVHRFIDFAGRPRWQRIATFTLLPIALILGIFHMNNAVQENLKASNQSFAQLVVSLLPKVNPNPILNGDRPLAQQQDQHGPPAMTLKIPATVQFNGVEVYHDFRLLHNSPGIKAVMMNMGPGIAQPAYFGIFARQISLLDKPASKTERDQVSNFANDLFKEFIHNIPRRTNGDLTAMGVGQGRSIVSAIDEYDPETQIKYGVIFVVGGMVYTDQTGTHRVGACVFSMPVNMVSEGWRSCHPAAMKGWETR